MNRLFATINTLTKAQMKFTEFIKEFLFNARDTTHLHVIKFDDKIICFF